jgi:hypothetical protein
LLSGESDKVAHGVMEAPMFYCRMEISLSLLGKSMVRVGQSVWPLHQRSAERPFGDAPSGDDAIPYRSFFDA